MRNALLTGLTALFLLGSCSPANKCKDSKYVYKEGEHPERIPLPMDFPIKQVQRDFTFNPETTQRLTVYAHWFSSKEPNKKTNKIPSPNYYPKISPLKINPFKVEYDIILSQELENLDPTYKGLNDEPRIVYLGPEEKKESVFKKLSEGFPQSYVIEGKFYPFYPGTYGNIGNANKIYTKTIENLLEKEN